MMSNEKMRASFEAWYEKEQIENTLFPSILKLFSENKIVLYSVWQAALALKAENETLKEITNTMNIVAPSDYEALKAENADLKLRVKELEAKSTMDVNQLKRIFEQRDGLEVERDKLQTRVAELEAASMHLGLTPLMARDGLARHKALVAERDKLQRECDQLRNRPFECWSNDDGDSWCEHPADSEFVGGLKVGDTFELLAGYDSVRVKYVVTKAPDDIDDDYEVKRAK